MMTSFWASLPPSSLYVVFSFSYPSHPSQRPPQYDWILPTYSFSLSLQAARCSALVEAGALDGSAWCRCQQHKTRNVKHSYCPLISLQGDKPSHFPGLLPLYLPSLEPWGSGKGKSFPCLCAFQWPETWSLSGLGNWLWMGAGVLDFGLLWRSLYICFIL